MRIEIGVQPNHSSWSFSSAMYVPASELKAKGLISLLDIERRDTRHIVAQLVERALRLMDSSAFAPRRRISAKGFHPFESVRNSVLPYAGKIASDMSRGPERLYLDRASGQGGSADPPHTPPPYHYDSRAIQCRFYEAWTLARALGVSEIVVDDDATESSSLAPLKCTLTFAESDRVGRSRRRSRRGRQDEPQTRPATNTITIHECQVGLFGNLLQAIAPFAEAHGFSIAFADPGLSAAFAHYHLTGKDILALPKRLAEAEDNIKAGASSVSPQVYRFLVKGLRVSGHAAGCRRVLMALQPHVKTLMRAIASSSMILGAHTWKMPGWVDEPSKQVIAKERRREERFLKAMGLILRSQRKTIPADGVLKLIKATPFEPELLGQFYRVVQPGRWEADLTRHVLDRVADRDSTTNKWKEAFGVEADALAFSHSYVTPLVRTVVTYGRQADARALRHQLTLALLQDGADIPVDESLAQLLMAGDDEEIFQQLLIIAQRAIAGNLDNERTRIENLLMLFSHSQAHPESIEWIERVLHLDSAPLFQAAGWALRRLKPRLFARCMKGAIFKSGKTIGDLRAAHSWTWFTRDIDELAMGHLVLALKERAITRKIYSASTVGDADREEKLWDRIEAAAVSEKIVEDGLSGYKRRDVLPVLLAGLKDADNSVRENCATAFSKTGLPSKEIERGLVDALTSDEHAGVRAAAAKTIGRLAFSSSRALKALSQAIKEDPFVQAPPDWSRGEVRDEAMRSLRRIGIPAVPTLLRVRVRGDVDGMCILYALDAVRPDLADQHWIGLQIRLKRDAKYRDEIRAAIRQEMAMRQQPPRQRKRPDGKKA